MQIYVRYIPSVVYKQIIDSLSSLKAFAVKDEAEVEKCVVQTEKTERERKTATISSPSEIANGMQTLFVFYSNNKYRFAGYYELIAASHVCGELPAWKQATELRNYLSEVLVKPREKRETIGRLSR